MRWNERMISKKHEIELYDILEKNIVEFIFKHANSVLTLNDLWKEILKISAAYIIELDALRIQLVRTLSLIEQKKKQRNFTQSLRKFIIEEGIIEEIKAAEKSFIEDQQTINIK